MTEYIITEEEWLRVYHVLPEMAHDIHSRPYNPQAEREMQCKTCIRNGLRECMYHGYPEDTIPFACSYKIGNNALRTVYEIPVFREGKDGE